MIARDWLQVRTELDRLRAGDLERENTADVQQVQTRSLSQDALMRHVADALRLGESERREGEAPRSRPRH